MTCVTSKLIFSTSLEGQELFLVKKPIFQYNIFLKRGSDHYAPRPPCRVCEMKPKLKLGAQARAPEAQQETQELGQKAPRYSTSETLHDLLQGTEDLVPLKDPGREKNREVEDHLTSPKR